MDRHGGLMEEPPDRRRQPDPRPDDPAEQGFIGDRDQSQNVPDRAVPDGDDERQSER